MAHENEYVAENDGLLPHHQDCPALFFTDHPERCRCAFLVMLDNRVTPPAVPAGEVD